MSKGRQVQGVPLGRFFTSLCLLLLAACGGGGGGGGGVAGGGIGGTGISAGVITGFGSIFVNGVEYETTGASISVDDDGTATEDDLEIGMKVIVEYDSGTTTARTVFYDPEVKGPVSNIDVAGNLAIVMGQTLVVDSATIFRNVGGLADLQIGDSVEASGFFDASGSLRVTYMERKTVPLQEFEVKGVVVNLDTVAKTFDINGITVDYSGVTTLPVFSNGSFVEAEGDSFLSNTLFADRLELEDPAFGNDDEVEVEGIVTDTTPSVGDFAVNGIPVELTAQTLFENGTVADIVLNARVEVEGNVSGGRLIAEKVQFRFRDESQFALDGRVQLVDSGTSTVRVFGVDVQITAETLLKDSRDGLIPFRLTDLTFGDFVEIAGFIDHTGKRVAAKLEREGDPGPGEEKLKGPVTGEIPFSTIEVLGIQGDVVGARFENLNDAPMTREAFFNTIDVGDIVELEGDFAGIFFDADKAEIEALIP